MGSNGSILAAASPSRPSRVEHAHHRSHTSVAHANTGTRNIHEKTSKPLTLQQAQLKQPFGSGGVNWASLWPRKQRQPRCADETPRPAETYGAVAVELRVFAPLVGSLNLSHRMLPTGWPFHIFHTNFTRDDASRLWYRHGEMGRAIREWRAAGREVHLHTYNDVWHKSTMKHKTRPSNTYPRMREFWTDYFTEDKILTLQSDTGFCPNSPFRIEQFTGVDWNGATWGSAVYGQGHPGQGGFSWRNRHAMYNCIDWLQDGTQHLSRGKRSVLWDWAWMRNEDAMFAKCMQGAKGDAKLENWSPQDPSSRGKRLHYRVGSMCLANKFSREHPAIDALLKGQPPPFGLHALCRAIESYGKCAWVEGGERGPRKPGEPPVAQAFKCERKGFSVDRAFDAWSQYCGANLDYMRACYDYDDASVARGQQLRLRTRPNMDASSSPSSSSSSSSSSSG